MVSPQALLHCLLCSSSWAFLHLCQETLLQLPRTAFASWLQLCSSSAPILEARSPPHTEYATPRVISPAAPMPAPEPLGHRTDVSPWVSQSLSEPEGFLAGATHNASATLHTLHFPATRTPTSISSPYWDPRPPMHMPVWVAFQQSSIALLSSARPLPCRGTRRSPQHQQPRP